MNTHCKCTNRNCPAAAVAGLVSCFHRIHTLAIAICFHQQLLFVDIVLDVVVADVVFVLLGQDVL